MKKPANDLPIADILFSAGKNGTVVGRLPSGKICLPTRAFHNQPRPGETISCQIYQETERAAYVGPANISFTAICTSGYEKGATNIRFQDEFGREYEMGSRWCDKFDPPITGETWTVFAFNSWKCGKKYVLPYEEKAKKSTSRQVSKPGQMLQPAAASQRFVRA